jgi:hypothetical protein
VSSCATSLANPWGMRTPTPGERGTPQELGGQYVSSPERPVAVPTFYQTFAAPTPPVFGIVAAADCFAAGTAVHAADGVRPIESIRPGDRLLSQDTDTGSLAYRPVLAVHRTPDVATMRVKTDDETITTTTYHRFWVAGQGWKMARELEPGDALRGLQGTVAVRSIEPDAGRQTVYNFDVDGDRNLFVGRPAGSPTTSRSPRSSTAPSTRRRWPPLAELDPAGKGDRPPPGERSPSAHRGSAGSVICLNSIFSVPNRFNARSACGPGPAPAGWSR